MTPALCLDEGSTTFFRELARQSGCTVPEWFKASLIADVRESGLMRLIIEVPVEKSSIEAAARALEEME